VKWTGQQEQPVELVHRVKLLGAKEPFNFFMIRIQLPQGVRTDVPQLKDLVDALYIKVADKWKAIGILLEIPKGTLAHIAERCQHDPHRCLLEMLEVWLEQIHPPASWPTMIEAVEFLGEKHLGRELREKYMYYTTSPSLTLQQGSGATFPVISPSELPQHQLSKSI